MKSASRSVFVRVFDKDHRGFTVTELLVGTAIVGILMALILPAVQASREAVRRAQCSARLRDLCLASQNFSSTHGHFPGAYPPTSRASPSGYRLLWSAHVSLLPYLELKNVQSLLDLEDDSLSLYHSPPTSVRNSTGLKQSVVAFQCPSDLGLPGSVNFRVSGGTSPGFHASVGVNPPDAALWGVVSRKGINSRSVRDGLSNTAFFSERVGGGQNANVVLLGLGTFLTAKDAADACRAAPMFLSVDSNSGRSWLPGGYHATWYNHIFTPNSRMLDCVNGPQMRYTGNGAISARSTHFGGVNVGLCDGATRFVNQNISEKVWRAIGSIDGNESFASSDW